MTLGRVPSNSYRFRHALMIIVATLAMSCSCNVFAYGGDSSNTWIFSAGSSAGVTFQTGSDANRNYSLELGIGYGLGSFELLLLGSYMGASASGSATYAAEADVQLNFTLIGDHANAFYIGARVGDQFINTGSSSTSSTLVGGVIGKRFQFGSGPVCYDPRVAIISTSTSAGLTSPTVQFVPLQFTFVF